MDVDGDTCTAEELKVEQEYQTVVTPTLWALVDEQDRSSFSLIPASRNPGHPTSYFGRNCDSSIELYIDLLDDLLDWLQARTCSSNWAQEKEYHRHWHLKYMFWPFSPSRNMIDKSRLNFERTLIFRENRLIVSRVKLARLLLRADRKYFLFLVLGGSIHVWFSSTIFLHYITMCLTLPYCLHIVYSLEPQTHSTR